MIEALLAFGLLFSTATELSLHGTSIGPGVLALVIWMVAIGIRTWRTGMRSNTRPALVLVAFWSVLALAMSIGTITGMATGARLDSGLVLHDVAAYTLVAAMSCLCAAAPLRLRLVCWMLAAGGALSLSLQLLCASGVIHIPGTDPWYWSRLRGWSDNPNQLAIGCLVIALLAWHLADTAAGLAGRLAAIVLLIPPLIAGRMSQSDTFLIALVVALPVWLSMKLIIWMSDTRPERSLRAASARVVLLAAPVLLMCLVPLVVTRSADVRAFSMRLLKKGGTEEAGELSLRLTLWHQGFERGVESGMLGLGPGPHLQTPAQIVAFHAADPSLPYHSAPPQNGTDDYEAHNTFLDVFTQGGLLAVASLLWLLARAMKCAYRARTAGLVYLLTSVAIFMTTGNIVRQPLVWFAVILGLTASDWTCAGRADPADPADPALEEPKRVLETAPARPP